MENIKYQVGESANRLLRPVRGSLADYLIVPAKGLGNEIVLLYHDHRRFPDGTPKEFGVHTNMTQDGMLGIPFIFDLSFIDVHVAGFEDPKDVLVALQSLNFELIFGQNTRFVQFAGSDLKPYLHLTLEVREGPDGKQCPEKIDTSVARRYFKVELEKHVWRGGLWRWFRFDVRTLTKMPRRIDSTDSFFMKVNQAPLEKPLSGEVHLKVLLTGIHYKPAF